MTASIENFEFTYGDAKGPGDMSAASANVVSGGKSNIGADRERNVRRVPRKLYRIGEIVEFTGVSRQTIHNYTSMGILREARRTNGDHRLYDESVFGRLELIEKMKLQRRTLQQIRDYFCSIDVQADAADEG